MDVMHKFKNEFLEERKDLLSKNHVYRNHITKFIKYLSLALVFAGFQPFLMPSWGSLSLYYKENTAYNVVGNTYFLS